MKNDYISRLKSFFRIYLTLWIPVFFTFLFVGFSRTSNIQEGSALVYILYVGIPFLICNFPFYPETLQIIISTPLFVPISLFFLTKIPSSVLKFFGYLAVNVYYFSLNIQNSEIIRLLFIWFWAFSLYDYFVRQRNESKTTVICDKFTENPILLAEILDRNLYKIVFLCSFPVTLLFCIAKKESPWDYFTDTKVVFQPSSDFQGIFPSFFDSSSGKKKLNNLTFSFWKIIIIVALLMQAIGHILLYFFD